MKKFYIYIPLIVFIALMYGAVWIDTFDPNYYYNENPVYMVNLTWDKPFIFRILTLWIARIIYLEVGLIPSLSVMAVVTISAVFMFFSLIYFFRYYLSEPVLPAFACAMCAMILTAYYRKIYDLATVGFFSIAFGLLARNKVREYMLLFPIATLNRETTFLLTLFFVVYFWKRLPFMKFLYIIIYQGGVYIIIKYVLTIIFIHNGGKQFAFDPMKYMGKYLDNPFAALIDLLLLIILICLIAWKWNKKPLYLRTAFLSIFPLQIVLHILLGYAFELRVLAESLPIVFLLAISNFTALNHQRQIAIPARSNPESVVTTKLA